MTSWFKPRRTLYKLADALVENRSVNMTLINEFANSCSTNRIIHKVLT